MDVVQVRFPASATPVTCDANGHELEVGEYCVVRTEHGSRVGRVTRATHKNPGWEGKGGKLFKILRGAGREDEEDHAHRTRQEENALEDARRRIAERGLPMRLTAVERDEGGRKITFFFTADGRVDFRALVRDLAATHRARIEMRQIGVRDEARLRGGYGHCGRPLCCSTWLPGFQPVSIRNAKAQGLSLSPSKISGMCGRLMCCLRYELDGKGRPITDSGCAGSCGGKGAEKAERKAEPPATARRRGEGERAARDGSAAREEKPSRRVRPARDGNPAPEGRPAREAKEERTGDAALGTEGSEAKGEAPREREGGGRRGGRRRSGRRGGRRRGRRPGRGEKGGNDRGKPGSGGTPSSG
jgi:cell fate regulator YaaT (PSP1 superfamily)